MPLWQGFWQRSPPVLVISKTKKQLQLRLFAAPCNFYF
nr:hypothetical protein [Salmonella enterica]